MSGLPSNRFRRPLFECSSSEWVQWPVFYSTRYSTWRWAYCRRIFGMKSRRVTLKEMVGTNASSWLSSWSDSIWWSLSFSCVQIGNPHRREAFHPGSQDHCPNRSLVRRSCLLAYYLTLWNGRVGHTKNQTHTHYLNCTLFCLSFISEANSRMFSPKCILNRCLML